jgi:hypothetical protein
MSKSWTKRQRATTVAAAVVIASQLMTGATPVSAQPIAHTSKTLQITENATLHLVRKDGATLYEKGTATGTLPGAVNARFETSLTKVTGTVTINVNGGGSLTIVVAGAPRSAGTVARFGGNMAVRRGTGRFRDAVGSGTFEGTVNRRTWAVTVTAKARLRY